MTANTSEQKRYGWWATFAGVSLQLIGLSWDAILHRLNPDLAAREGVFTLANPSHLLTVAGLGLVTVGVLWELCFAEGGVFQGSRRRLLTILCSLALVGLAGATAGIGLATGGASATHTHSTSPGVAAAAHDENHDAVDATAVANVPTAQTLLQLVREQGTSQALTRLEELANTDQAVLSEAHNYAHLIGKFSYSYYKDGPKAFGQCRELFQSGCYHGVLEAYFAATPNFGAREVVALCDQAVAQGSAMIVRFQCLHGMGHGLTSSFEHDIFKALQYCDYLTSDWDRSSCHGGVFMENVIFAWEQRFGSATQMARHDHGGNHQSHLKAEDPLYPCNALQEQYLQQCYLMQTSAILMFNGNDFARAFQECDKAPERWQPTCYQSLGRDASGSTLRDSDRTYQLCELGGARLRGSCYVGAILNFIDVTWKLDQALTFCQHVPNEYKAQCYAGIGGQIAALHTEQETRARECARVEAGYQDACTNAALGRQ
jgi:hypothetical protein